ncbi:hypothetical protein AcW1_004553 [Taiwanofungus camphoratus]|nr:hypothetical protein AcW2_006442 [Antrodia cinnamomea]KAI0939555.1 hypothetical protein AcV5_000935 [Antrodia cinnamomea]KAI0952472.1 hypothetical protein AcV7_008265 [Antrodia cinnamomea]KAI0959849.1 hypothetical protein AcW1_004553 [Antrodia cinnamomea]
MGFIGIGVDVVYLPRIVSFIKRRTARRLASRILSNDELAAWDSIPPRDDLRRTRFLAVRWSVKEAAYKALYPLARPTWKELTFHGLQHGANGRKPTLEFRPTSPGLAVGTVHVSVSHDGEYVFANVLIEEPSIPSA